MLLSLILCKLNAFIIIIFEKHSYKNFQKERKLNKKSIHYTFLYTYVNEINTSPNYT